MTDDESTEGTVLMVGDEPGLKESIKKIISKYRLLETNSKEALQKAQAHMPDLIIYDPAAAEDHGFAFLRTLKEDEKLSRIPVILLTGEASEEMRVEGLEAGADDYISKPYNEKVLLMRVKNLVRLHIQEKALKKLNEQLERKLSEQLDVIVKNERLTKFFPKKLVKWILSSDKDVELSSEKKCITVFFSDLSGFTEFAESTPPEKVMNLLNEYFTEMVKIVDRCEGTLDKFIGDGLMVFFGAPDPMSEKIQAVRAVSMAVAMQVKMKELTRKWKDQGIMQTVQIRMGIHQDSVMVGNFGSRQLMEYTVFGSGVNLANRLESYCEPQKILVSLPVYTRTRDLFPYTKVWEQQFRSFERLVTVAELDPEKMD